MSVGQCERDRTPSSLRLLIGSPDKGGTHPLLDSKLQGLSVYVQRERSRSSHRTRSCSKEEIRKELQSISKALHFPSGHGPLISP